jgi:folate-dependent phosphoribosylglycinamide formyltransferase PurN
MGGNDEAVHRIALFVNENSPESLFLARAAVDCIGGTPGFDVAAVVETSRSRPPSRWGRALSELRHRVTHHAFGSPMGRDRLPGTWRLDARSIAAHAGAPVLHVPERSVNHPDFVALIRREHSDAIALVLLCLQIFRRDLLESFSMAVNFHDGFLPSHRGLGATHWSIDRGEKQSGFTFHRMADAIDRGPILLEGAVPIDEEATLTTVDAAKTRAAARLLPALLAAIARRAPGRDQQAGGAYFNRRDLEDGKKIDEPQAFTAAGLIRRLRAFELLHMRINDEVLPVTALADAEPGARDVFLTRDGVHLRAHRVLHLPPALYRLASPWIGGVRG